MIIESSKLRQTILKNIYFAIYKTDDSLRHSLNIKENDLSGEGVDLLTDCKFWFLNRELHRAQQ